eukprot:m.364039 g.364039  ORF g.364039 m.364039 type:complete len:135 (+) comp56033_c1_seq15:103-507(+)
MAKKATRAQLDRLLSVTGNPTEMFALVEAVALKVTLANQDTIRTIARDPKAATCQGLLARVGKWVDELPDRSHLQVFAVEHASTCLDFLMDELVAARGTELVEALIALSTFDADRDKEPKQGQGYLSVPFPEQF